MKTLSALAVLATVSTFTIGPCLQSAYAQTQGMERRTDRRDNRQDARDTKHECNAASDKSRAECRQGKRDEKQTGRQGGDTPATDPTPIQTTPPN